MGSRVASWIDAPENDCVFVSFVVSVWQINQMWRSWWSSQRVWPERGNISSSHAKLKANHSESCNITLLRNAFLLFLGDLEMVIRITSRDCKTTAYYIKTMWNKTIIHILDFTAACAFVCAGVKFSRIKRIILFSPLVCLSVFTLSTKWLLWCCTGLIKLTGSKWMMISPPTPWLPALISTSKTLTSRTTGRTAAWRPTWWEKPSMITSFMSMVRTRTLSVSLRKLFPRAICQSVKPVLDEMTLLMGCFQCKCLKSWLNLCLDKRPVM